MKHQSGAFPALLCMILGAGLLLFAVKDFVVPVVAGILGYMLTNYGLRMRHKPPVDVLVKRWLSELL